VPTYDENKQPIANRRALTSIDLYHLNHTVLKKARKRLYNKIRDLVTMGDEHFIDPLDARYEQSRAILLSQLLELQEEDIEYWAATRRYLSSFVNSSKRPWLEAVVTGG
ncbi:MAG: hypothetical protein JWL77_7004, partial [Chthonomonadaceae bacterium]|nr:hypothetical protein [Chthonomonadaceae bacterium]